MKLNSSIMSNETISLVKKWINECRPKHSRCQLSVDRKELPTRLVHIQPLRTSSGQRANIYYGKTLPSRTIYPTLSHCWGRTKFLTTTRANLSSFESSLPIQSLSRTFQDAIFTTVNLGFYYIWIDSLCIVQDEPEEWKRESLLMHEVHRNASCNLSAAGFASGENGVLLNERRINSDPVSVTLSDRISMTDSSTLETVPSKTYRLTHADPWHGMYTGPIFLRAWTLQEQLLVSAIATDEPVPRSDP